jgi:hypothetical protein
VIAITVVQRAFRQIAKIPATAGAARERTTMEKIMSKHFTTKIEQGTRVLPGSELDAVTGGWQGYPGLSLGTKLNISRWGLTTPFDLQWELVGATGSSSPR